MTKLPEWAKSETEQWFVLDKRRAREALSIAWEVLEKIATADYRGNKPWESTDCKEALRRIEDLGK